MLGQGERLSVCLVGGDVRQTTASRRVGHFPLSFGFVLSACCLVGVLDDNSCESVVWFRCRVVPGSVLSSLSTSGSTPCQTPSTSVACCSIVFTPSSERECPYSVGLFNAFIRRPSRR